jgi:hypothetical protein
MGTSTALMMLMSQQVMVLWRLCFYCSARPLLWPSAGVSVAAGPFLLVNIGLGLEYASSLAGNFFPLFP